MICTTAFPVSMTNGCRATNEAQGIFMSTVTQSVCVYIQQSDMQAASTVYGPTNSLNQNSEIS